MKEQFQHKADLPGIREVFAPLILEAFEARAAKVKRLIDHMGRGYRRFISLVKPTTQHEGGK